MIYLFDKDEKLIKIVRKSAVKTALQKYALTTERYVSDRLTVELKGLNADELEQVEYMAIQTMEDAHTFHYFYVAQKFSDSLTTLIGVQSGIEELRKSPVFDKRPSNALARPVITDLLAGTNWQARFVGETAPHSTNFYYTSVFDALKKVCVVWDLEMQFFVEMNGNRIGARYIDFKQKIGQAVGKRVVYGHNALQILQEVERTNIFTALVGRGKGEETGDGYGRKITFEDVVWSRAQGKPVDKHKGQKYLELPLMTQQYGIKNADGSMRPKIGFVDFSEEENPEVLIERTYKALIDAARPQLTLKTSSVYLRGVKVGDTIRVVRHDKKLDYDTRVFEITFNRLNNQSSDIKLGDRIGESNEAKAQTIADKAVEQFVNNEFSNFVQSLPDYLPSADGFNNNWYGAEDPTVKYPGKVLINDIWYKPDPEHDGHKIMLRWTGEVWEEILRTYESEALRDRIAEEIAQVNTSMQAQSEEHGRQVADILSKTQSVETLATQAKLDAASAIVKAVQSKDEAIAEASVLLETAKGILSGQINSVSIDLTKTKEAIKLLATRATVDALTGRISSAESTLQVQAGEIASRVKSSDFEKATQRLSTAESSITQTSKGVEQLTTSLATTDGKVSTAETNIRQLISDVSSKVSQTDYNTLTGRVSSAETAITQNATEISKRLTSTQVESAITAKGYQTATQVNTAITRKGYQTKSDVDSNINGRGYITNSALQPYALSTTVQNLVKETADSFSRTISETKALIPTENGGTNLIIGSMTRLPTPYQQATLIFTKKQSVQEWQATDAVRVQGTKGSSNIFCYLSTGQSNNNSTSGVRYVHSIYIKNTGAPFQISNNLRKTIDIATGETKRVVIFDVGTGTSYLQITFQQSGTGQLDFYYWHPQIETGTIVNDWSPAYEDLATVTALHNVSDTVDSHTRTIGAVGTAGSILDNVSKVTQTAAGLVQEVSGANGLKTQVSTLAGSYAIKNLTSAGTVLNQLNLNRDGSVRIDGKLVQITGTTYIQDGVISSAKIGSLDAGKITTGTLDASRVNVVKLNASNIATGTLTANMISGGVLSSLNDVTSFNLQTGELRTMGATSGVSLKNGALDFIRKDGTSIAGYSTIVDSNGRIIGGAIGSHDSFDFYITTKTGGKPMLKFTNSNKIIFSSDTVLVSNQASENESIGLYLKRYNKGGGWCTAFVSTTGTGIEFYDNGKVRTINSSGYKDII